jgi:predicted RNA binding protein YcfA (HicA-like mRNA interferase family)
VRLVHADGRLTVVPVHRGEDLDRGLLRTILRECGLGREEFLSLLKQR